VVKNIEELKKANSAAMPGDIIVLQNGEWKDVVITLNCTGTKEQPIIFKAQYAGKVLITGHSQLKLGGSFIVVDGFYFTKGYAGNDAIIDFRISKKQLANNCRVTNTVINDFNNPKRMDENYWISLSGKNNRIDHCSFLNKKNMGVLMAVILDDERSRENFHSIDHNYFGVRLPLASNSGEIIRVGVSQHCEFNSNTQIVDNFFEHCDGETEIISIKSCSNVVRNNLFKECQGGVVLRHGNYNTVEGNIFLGNDKEGTGGVRIINKGQWVVNNLFYKCRGVGFRSPLSIMNGVPNSPAFRYVAVTDAVIANNSFYNCTPISLCEGSDTERSVIPHAVYFGENVFYNDMDSKIYNAYDDIRGISFVNNIVGSERKRELTEGFYQEKLMTNKVEKVIVPLPYPSKTAHRIPDSLREQSKGRITSALTSYQGFHGAELYLRIKRNAYNNCGAKWWKNSTDLFKKPMVINVPDFDALAKELAIKRDVPIVLRLTGNRYPIMSTLAIDGNVTITTDKKIVEFSSVMLGYFFLMKGGASLTLDNFFGRGEGLGVDYFISTDTSGSSNHSNFTVKNSSMEDLGDVFFNAAKSSVLDSIIVSNSRFSYFSYKKGVLFDLSNETDKKGYYSVEKISFANNSFENNKVQLLSLLRGGNDESTMGPLLSFTNNKITNCNSKEVPLIKLYGTQQSSITNNTFSNSNDGNVLIKYEDAVRAAHTLNNNSITKSGKIETNKYVTEKDNIIK